MGVLKSLRKAHFGVPFFLWPLIGVHIFLFVYSQMGNPAASQATILINLIVLTVLCLALLIFDISNKQEMKELKMYALNLERNRPSEEDLKNIDEVAAEIACEINHPLTVINGHTRRMNKSLEAIDSGNTGDITALRTNLEKINATTTQISHSIKDLISYLQKEQQSSRPLNSFTIKSLLDRIKKYVLVNISLPFKLIIPQNWSIEESIIRGNLHLVERVVSGMIENSEKANAGRPDGWINLEFKLTTKEDRRAFVHIIVTDSGNGVDAFLVDKIFDHNVSKNKQDKKNKKFNLGMSRKMIRQHGGELQLNTTSPNTQFILELPLINLF